MDISAILLDHLNFIRRFYDTAALPFSETIRKIEHGEETYGPSTGEPDGEPNGDPPHLQEWLAAKESLNILGQCCLCLAQTALKDFLIAFVERSGKDLPARGKGESWFEACQVFFLIEYGIDWVQTGVDLSLLEEANLAQDDIQQEGTAYDLARLQHEGHARRFPDSIFASQLDRVIFPEFSKSEPCRGEVTPEGLMKGLEAVQEFCTIVDQWPTVTH